MEFSLLQYIILGIISLFALYIIIRIIFKAAFKSMFEGYFETKKKFEKQHEKGELEDATIQQRRNEKAIAQQNQKQS
jgi:hypothetical protein